MPPLTRQADYELLNQLANTAESGGLAKERSVLLLWFMRNVLGLDDLDAYEFVCDGDDDGGVDGMYLERALGDDEYETLDIYQSKYTEAPTLVGPTAFDRLVTIASQFKDASSLRSLLSGPIEEKLEVLIKRFDLERKLREGDFLNGRLRIRINLVTSGVLNAGAKRLVEAVNTAEGRPGYLTVYDITRLGPLARAVAAPTPAVASIQVPCPSGGRLVVGSAPNRVAVVAVRATDIVTWPGIDDRTLFELNVRRELRPNRVRLQLDRAIRRRHEHSDFMSCHNGMTVTCDSFAVEGSRLVVTRPSIVNGAQSAIAFARANQEGALSDELRVFIKFVEVGGRRQLAKEVSWKSNTQTTVNARNLMALGGPQERIRQEFLASFPQIEYEIRPDASYSPAPGHTIIQNDDAAQLLCAVFNAMPWLAVKRLSLFESDNHAMIFRPEIGAEHVVLADTIRKEVDIHKTLFPDRYRQSWRLTRLVAVYMVAQVMRSDPATQRLLDDPAAGLRSTVQVASLLEGPVRAVAATLAQRHDKRLRDRVQDEFNVDFKREDALKELAGQARDNFALIRAMQAQPPLV